MSLTVFLPTKQGKMVFVVHQHCQARRFALGRYKCHHQPGGKGQVVLPASDKGRVFQIRQAERGKEEP